MMIAKITLWLCGIITAITILGLFACSVKATWQYLSLPIYGCSKL
jgi:hypothetical protein